MILGQKEKENHTDDEEDGKTTDTDTRALGDVDAGIDHRRRKGVVEQTAEEVGAFVKDIVKTEKFTLFFGRGEFAEVAARECLNSALENTDSAGEDKEVDKTLHKYAVNDKSEISDDGNCDQKLCSEALREIAEDDAENTEQHQTENKTDGNNI